MKYITRKFNYMTVTIKAYERTKGFYEYEYPIPAMRIDKVMKYIKKNIDRNIIDVDVNDEIHTVTRRISMEKFFENSEVVN